MISRATVICIMAMLLFVSGVIAGEDPLFQGKDRSTGNSQVPNTRIRLQEYSNGIPQNGNYYEWDGSKWQRYKGAIPQQGSYLKEVKPEERLPETREAK
jgi:hypothetical protein